jgi:Putative adhesin
MTLFYVVVGLIAPAIAFAQSGPFHWNDRIPAGATLHVFTTRGDIHLSRATGDHADVASTPDQPARLVFQVVHGADNDVAICAFPVGGRARCGVNGLDFDDDNHNTNDRTPRADFTIQLPPGVNVVLSSGYGQIDAADPGANISATSGNGAIRVTHAAGAVRATSGNGDVAVDDAGGRVHATTGNGRVEVTTAAGPVDVTTGNGPIDVRMRTIAAASDMQFSTGNGTITVSLPGAFAGHLEANTGHGAVSSEFALQTIGLITPSHIRADIGSPAAAGSGPRLRLSTGNGDLVLRKAE